MKYLNIQNIIIVASILALILLAVFLFKIISCSDSVEYIPEEFFESNIPLQNPYCGFYHIIRYTLSDEYTPLDSFYHEISEYTQSLVLLEINLKNYRTTVISKNGIEELNCILSAWSRSETGTKLIIRFLYDWDGLALATEPDSIELILKHMEQVCQAVNKYSDIVYIIQGAFIGNWGEMHHSEFSDPNSVKMLINRLNELANPEIYLSVRTPYLWRLVNNMYELPENLQTFEADNSCIIARLGLFNDGILGSETDLGTYGNTLKKDALSPAYHGVRTEELKFQNKLCMYVPNGGEVVYNNNLCELENAVSTLKEMHVSYLNADYDSTVFDKWKNTVWTKKDCFYGCDGYSYIKAHIGYRYLIKSSKIKKSGLFKPEYYLSISIKNDGFSNTLKQFVVSIMLINQAGECTEVPINADLRDIYSGEQKSLTAKLPVDELKKGDYLVYICVKDQASGQTVFLGNKNEITENGYLLGRLMK